MWTPSKAAPITAAAISPILMGGFSRICLRSACTVQRAQARITDRDYSGAVHGDQTHSSAARREPDGSILCADGAVPPLFPGLAGPIDGE